MATRVTNSFVYRIVTHWTVHDVMRMVEVGEIVKSPPWRECSS